MYSRPTGGKVQDSEGDVGLISGVMGNVSMTRVTTQL